MQQHKSPGRGDFAAKSAVNASISALLLFQVFGLTVAALVRRLLIVNETVPAKATLLGSLAGFVILSLFLYPLLRANWPILKSQYSKPPAWPRLCVTSIALGTLFWIVNSMALVWIGIYAALPTANLTNPVSLTYTFSCATQPALLLTILVMSICTPLIEEIVNRGLLLQTLLRKGKWVAIAISATLFMILHDPPLSPAKFCFGVVAAAQLLHWRSMWAPVLTHATANLMVVIQQVCITRSFDPGRVNWEFAGNPQLFVSALLICCVAAWWLATRCPTE